MMSTFISQLFLHTWVPFQSTGLFDFVLTRWWVPGVIVVAGMLLYGIPQVDRFIGHQFQEWKRLPRQFRYPVVGILIGGAGLVVFSQLAEFDWLYVLFLFGYARAVEGGTVLHLFARLNDAMRKVFGDSSSTPGSKIKHIASWAVRQLMKRFPLLIVSILLSTLVAGLLVAVLIGFPDTPLGAKLAFVATIATLALSMVNSAWVFSKVSNEIGQGAFLGLVCCVVGGELYNVPAALSLFSGIEAVRGPFAAWTTVTVGTIGWAMGLILAVAFLIRRVR